MPPIAHLDMDAFYVSVELQRRPELRGLPVVVAGTGPRAVVTTASYEARRFGVFSATPAERARRLCPQAVFVPPDFDLDRARSREVMAVLRERIGLACSIGIGPNKLVAKVASDADKPDGFTVLSQEMARDRFAGASPG